MPHHVGAGSDVVDQSLLMFRFAFGVHCVGDLKAIEGKLARNQERIGEVLLGNVHSGDVTADALMERRRCKCRANEVCLQEGGVDVLVPVKARPGVNRDLRWRRSRGVSSEIVAPRIWVICGDRVGGCSLVYVVLCGAHTLIILRKRAIIRLRPIAFTIAAELFSKRGRAWVEIGY
jgi:hypothetical protein